MSFEISIFVYPQRNNFKQQWNSTFYVKIFQIFGFIKRVDKGWITTMKGLESWRFQR